MDRPRTAGSFRPDWSDRRDVPAGRLRPWACPGCTRSPRRISPPLLPSLGNRRDADLLGREIGPPQCRMRREETGRENQIADQRAAIEGNCRRITIHEPGERIAVGLCLLEPADEVAREEEKQAGRE